MEICWNSSLNIGNVVIWIQNCKFFNNQNFLPVPLSLWNTLTWKGNTVLTKVYFIGQCFLFLQMYNEILHFFVCFVFSFLVASFQQRQQHIFLAIFDMQTSGLNAIWLKNYLLLHLGFNCFCFFYFSNRSIIFGPLGWIICSSSVLGRSVGRWGCLGNCLGCRCGWRGCWCLSWSTLYRRDIELFLQSLE